MAIGYDTLIVIGLWLVAAAVVSPFDNDNQHALRDPVFTAYLVAVWFVYLAYFWIHGGMTVGMRAWKVQLLADPGFSINWRTCLLRFAVSLLAAAPLGLGFAWSLFDTRQRCWQDLLSHSCLYHSD